MKVYEVCKKGDSMKLVYPAIFTKFEDGAPGYVVTFPDLPGCVTEGEDMAEALFMAQDAASGWILTELEEGNDIPEASDYKEVQKMRGDFVSLIALDMDTYAAKYGQKAIKKTLTIPAWMNTFAEKNAISCSSVLQDALGKMVLAARK